MVRVLALQHIRDDHPGLLGEMMQEYGIECESVNVEEDPFLPWMDIRRSSRWVERNMPTTM